MMTPDNKTADLLTELDLWGACVKLGDLAGNPPHLTLMKWEEPPAPARLKSGSVTAEWYIECQLYGWLMLEQQIEIDHDRRGGVPLLRGTGFTVAHIFDERAESVAVVEVVDNFDLQVEQIRDILNGFSLIMQRRVDK